MRPRSIALLLLLALGLRLSAGPHPCHAMAAPSAAPAAHASCHQESPPKAPAPGGEDCCQNGDSLCDHACQTAAVLRVALPAPVPLSFEEQVSPPEHRATPPVVFPIDHVPLA